MLHIVVLFAIVCLYIYGETEVSTPTTILTKQTYVAANNSSSSNTKELACKAIESSFNNTTASIEQKQQYAQCVDILYPLYSSDDILVMKVLVIISFLAFTFGFIKGCKEADLGIGLLLGAGFALGIPFILVVLYSGITFLFS